jgi:predicted nucleic acid-binding Zn ribbon protein
MPDSEKPKEVCTVCGGDIEVQIFLGSGVCCENCRAIKKGDFKKVSH